MKYLKVNLLGEVGIASSPEPGDTIVAQGKEAVLTRLLCQTATFRGSVYWLPLQADLLATPEEITAYGQTAQAWLARPEHYPKGAAMMAEFCAATTATNLPE